MGNHGGIGVHLNLDAPNYKSYFVFYFSFKFLIALILVTKIKKEMTTLGIENK